MTDEEAIEKISREISRRFTDHYIKPNYVVRNTQNLRMLFEHEFKKYAEANGYKVVGFKWNEDFSSVQPIFELERIEIHLSLK